MEPSIQYAKTEHGVSIAYTTLGQGSPLVLANGCWLGMLSYGLDNSFGGPFYRAIAEQHTIVCYDRRGTGLSDRDRPAFTLDAVPADPDLILDRGLALIVAGVSGVDGGAHVTTSVVLVGRVHAALPDTSAPPRSIGLDCNIAPSSSALCGRV